MHAEADEKGLTDDGGRATVEEIRIAIEGLSDDDVAQFVYAAKTYSRFCGIAPDELLQEAYTRALEGRRSCTRGTNIVAFLCGVMRSFTSQENDARRSGLRPVTVMRNGEPVLPDVAADIISPEQAAVSAIDDVPVLAQIEALIADDEQLQLLVEGLADRMRGAQLQELLDTDEKGLAALRRKLIRRLQVAFPDRIKS